MVQGQLIHKNLGNCLHFFLHFLLPSSEPSASVFGKHKKARSAFADKHYDIALRNSEGPRCHSHELCARSRHPPKHSPKIPEERWLGSLCLQAVTFRSKAANKMYCSSYFIRRSSLRCLISAHPFGALSRVAVLYFFPSPPFPSPSRLRRRDVRGAPKVDDDVVLWSSITAAAPPG